MSTIKRQVFVFSDTHLGCRSSIFYIPQSAPASERERKTQLMQRLRAQMSKADIVVMNGDIFDLLYTAHLRKSPKTRREAIETEVDDSIATLEDWLSNELAGKEVYFNLGNHENVRMFWKKLKDLEKAYDGKDGKCKFIAKKHFKKLGDVGFTHGDMDINQQTLETREVPKVGLLAAQAIEMGNFWLERIVQKGVVNMRHVSEKICKAVANSLAKNTHLADQYPNLLSRLKYIIFSHTHIPINAHALAVSELNFIRFYNTGSATNHGVDAFLTFDIEVNNKGKYGSASNFNVLAMFADVRRVPAKNYSR